MMFPRNSLGIRSTSVLLLALAGVLLANLAHSAFGEERKFNVMLALPSKSVEGDVSELELPNSYDIWDQYFDENKDSGEDRVDSFAEYWDEISYGNVSVSGDVFGWVEIPWPVQPATHESLDGRLWFTDLNNSGSMNQFQGERVPSSQLQAIMIDYNGDGDGSATPGYEMFWFIDIPTPGLQDFNPITGEPVWTPGERFLDMDGDGRYDRLLEFVWDGYVNDCVLDGFVDAGEVVDDTDFVGPLFADDDEEWDFPEPFEDFLVIYNPYGQ